MSEKRYKIVNTTVKKPAMEKGKDTRKMIEKVGHSVQFRTEDNKIVVLPPGRGTIISKVDGGILGLKRAGMISIEEIEDVATALKEHTLERQNTKSEKEKAAKKKKTSRKAKSVEMGRDDHGEGKSQDANEGYEGATNPDGAGNHRVVAPNKKKKKKKKSRRKTVTEENIEDGDMLDEVQMSDKKEESSEQAEAL